ncbi:MAG: hypothetical protein AAGG44_20150, partial [Planctomycetota bacterium]
ERTLINTAMERLAALGRLRSCGQLVFIVAISVGLAAGQEIGSSVVGTEFDFIIDEDESVYAGIRFVDRALAEMPDKRDDAELMQQAYEFEAGFRDGSRIRIFVDADFNTTDAAEAEAKRYCGPLGRLPSVLRKGVARLVVHRGGKDTTAFSDEGLIVVYSENATVRISNHDLEETIFHESVHAAWDKGHAASEGWKRAQHADGNFATLYAKRNPRREDLAETALFAYTLTHHPTRLPNELSKTLRRRIPHRIAYVAELIPAGKPIMDLPQEKPDIEAAPSKR